VIIVEEIVAKHAINAKNVESVFVRHVMIVVVLVSEVENNVRVAVDMV
jgi:hypothetical protein